MRTVDLAKPLPPSVVALVIANLIPLYGVYAWGWRVFPIIVLSWLENCIIGTYMLLKVLFVSSARRPKWLYKLLTFIVCGASVAGIAAGDGLMVILPLYAFCTDVPVLSDRLTISFILQVLTHYQLTLPLLALVASHGFSMLWNYLVKGEFRRVSARQLSASALQRASRMHIPLVVGGWILIPLNEPKTLLTVLVVSKIWMDLRAHLCEHAQLDKAKQQASHSI